MANVYLIYGIKPLNFKHWISNKFEFDFLIKVGSIIAGLAKFYF